MVSNREHFIKSCFPNFKSGSRILVLFWYHAYNYYDTDNLKNGNCETGFIRERAHPKGRGIILKVLIVQLSSVLISSYLKRG